MHPDNRFQEEVSEEILELEEFDQNEQLRGHEESFSKKQE